MTFATYAAAVVIMLTNTAVVVTAKSDIKETIAKTDNAASYEEAWNDGRDATIQAIIAGACANNDDTKNCLKRFKEIVTNLEEKGQ